MLVALSAVLLGALLMVGVARAGRQVAEVHRAQAIADVAALAGAAAGPSALAQVAAANGATVLQVEERRDGGVDVTVDVAGAVASAAAARG